MAALLLSGSDALLETHNSSAWPPRLGTTHGCLRRAEKSRRWCAGTDVISADHQVHVSSAYVLFKSLNMKIRQLLVVQLCQNGFTSMYYYSLTANLAKGKFRCGWPLRQKWHFPSDCLGWMAHIAFVPEVWLHDLLCGKIPSWLLQVSLGLSLFQLVILPWPVSHVDPMYTFSFLGTLTPWS